MTTAAADSPSTSPSYETICALLETSTYDSAIIPVLKAYVRAQVVEGAPYSFDANRTLAKLHNFFPQLVNDSSEGGSIALVLFLALLQVPYSTDFFALCCLIPERVQSKEPCATLVRCSELLENCQFPEFWSTYSQLLTTGSSPSSALLHDAAKGSQDKIRLAILSVLALSYREIPVAVALPSLNFTSYKDMEAFRMRNPAEVAMLVEDASSSDSDRSASIRFLPTLDNTKRSRVYKEGIHLESVATLIAAARE